MKTFYCVPSSLSLVTFTFVKATEATVNIDITRGGQNVPDFVNLFTYDEGEIILAQRDDKVTIRNVEYCYGVTYENLSTKAKQFFEEVEEIGCLDEYEADGYRLLVIDDRYLVENGLLSDVAAYMARPDVAEALGYAMEILPLEKD